ncbi:hypothetical protein SAMD00079811_27560 [Scytonema sp. HK-05]|nr:hypothetical protein SAMD00079811_27560 [Scytonema sp. HK-05]
MRLESPAFRRGECQIGEKHLSGHYDAIIKLNNPRGLGFAA